MGVRATTYIWDHAPENRSDLLVLLALADYCNDEFQCWPSVKSIAQKCRMTERGVQKIIRRLEDENWLFIDTGNGRKGCNQYKINPEHGSPPNTVHPEHRCTKPRTEVQETLNSGSPEPSITINKPSKEKNTKKEKTPLAELERVLPKELSMAIIEHRKAKKSPLTTLAAKLLASEFEKTKAPEQAAEYMLLRGWVAFKASWKWEANTSGQNSQTQRTAFGDIPDNTHMSPEDIQRKAGMIQ